MDIEVTPKEKDTYTVRVSDRKGSKTYTVILADAYHTRLARSGETKESLISRSFGFLLERESKESILSSFDLPVIGRYFPEYERVISR
jgi:hypothetical protein